MKKSMSLLLCLLIVVSITACGGEAPDKIGDSDSVESTSEVLTVDDYAYADIDLGGTDFTILNQNYTNSYSYIDVEMNGDILDDAMWKRNKAVEERYNFNLIEVNKTAADVAAETRNTVLANDDVYQVIYSHTSNMSGMLTDNLYWDLNSGGGFQFDKPWWDEAVMADIPVGDDNAVYFASSNISLHNFEMSWCMYFNRTMLENLQLELPYQLVFDGRWTYDELYKYTSSAYNLNGDSSFAWNANGNAVYGFTSMQPDCITQSFVACGEKYIQMNDSNPVFTAGSDKFYQVAEKLAKVYGTEGAAIWANNRDKGEHYELIFGSGRALFVGCELKSGDGGGVYADMKDDYGIVPMPKFDEAQNDYISPVALWTVFMTVPMSNPDISTTSYILDTLAYLSYRDVVPTYYDVTLSVKNIRDEETRDVLDIIRRTRTYYTAYAYNWGATIRSNIADKIITGSADLASVIASNKPSIEAEFDKFNTAINK